MFLENRVTTQLI